MLHDLQAIDRRVFEYWGHAASFLPMADFRFYLPRMKEFNDPKNKWMRGRLEKFRYMMQPVLERITNEGPLSSSAFEKPADNANRGWWGWRPAKVALELLFWQGKLMITERRNFQRVYDLTERVLPSGHDTRYPGDDEQARFFIARALNAYGIASAKEICEHLHGADKKKTGSMIKDMIATGELQEIAIEGIANSSYSTTSAILDKLSKPKRTTARACILSPFDNLIIQRDRTLKLFGFDYALECYTPAAKRKHGYFVMPILYGDTFAGRLDPKADRKQQTLIIRKLILEDGFAVDDKFVAELVKALVDMMMFNNCEKIKLEKTSPANFKQALNKAIRAAI